MGIWKGMKQLLKWMHADNYAMREISDTCTYTAPNVAVLKSDNKSVRLCGDFR